MSVSFGLVLFGLAGAAALLLTLPEGSPWGRRVCLAGAAAGVGGCAWTLARALGDGLTASRGFEADPWRAGLMLGAVVPAAAALLHRDRAGVEETRARAALLAGTGACVASLAASDAFSAAALFAVTTVSFGVVAYASGSAACVRAITWFAASDVAAAVGFFLLAGDGMRLPLRANGVGAALLAGAALVRSGALPFRWNERAVRRDGRAAALALGGMRAQAFAMAAWVAFGRSDVAGVMAVTGAVAAATCARRAAREASFPAASSASAGLVLCGIGIGGIAASAGAVFVAAGAFLAAAIALVGYERILSPLVTGAPLSAALPGAVLVASAGLARAPVEAGMLPVAIAAGAALVWLSQAGVAGVGLWGGSRSPAPWIWAAVLAAGGVAIAVVPFWSLTGVAQPAARAFGLGRPLAGVPGAVTNDLGLALAAAALGALAAPIRAARAVMEPTAPLATEEADLAFRRVGPLGALVLGSLGALLWVGIRRGFL